MGNELLWQLRKRRNIQEVKQGSGDEEGDLITSQTLETVLKEEKTVFSVSGIWGGWGVSELGIRLVTLWLANPGKLDLGGVVDYDIITGSNMKWAKAVNEEFFKITKQQD